MTRRGALIGGPQFEHMKKPSLHSARLANAKRSPYQRAATVMRVVAAVGLLAVLVGCGVIWNERRLLHGFPGEFVVLAVVLSTLLIGLYWTGTAVARHEAWARKVGAVYSLILLIGFPVGTAIGGYILWQLIFGWEDDEIDDVS
jgi:uncharacterized membrane protein YkgB